MVGAERTERVRVVMARMAAGDRAAVFTLATEFGGQIAAVLRRQLREFGVDIVHPDDLGGLVTDACLELFACAPAWRPDGGALPWTWAERRLRALVSSFVGIHADPIAPGGPEAAAEAVASPSVPEGDEVEVLAELARLRPECALLVEALERVASARNRVILLSVKAQAAAGDPSPAVTVAREHGLRPDAVRQVTKRVLDRLRALAAVDERFAPLADLALLA